MQCCQKPPEHRFKSDHIDPVCGMELRGKDPDLSAVHNGRTYHFCAEACLNEFKQHPDRCLDPTRNSQGKKKGIWGRYLERLSKATSGQAIKCH